MEYTCIILIGNDGVGKTSITKELNKYAANSGEDKYHYFFERSMTDFPDEKCNNIYTHIKPYIEIFDKSTLLYTWETRPSIPEQQFIMSTELESYTCKFKYIVIDSDIDIIMERLSHRDTSDIWESRKAIEYFSYRYREISSYYGFPLINNDNKLTIPEVAGYIIKLLNIYEHISAFATIKFTRDYLADLDIETTLVKLLNDNVIDIPFSETELCELNVLKYESHAIFKARKLINECMTITDTCIRFTFNNHVLYEMKMAPYIYIEREGESKKIYRVISSSSSNHYYDTMCIILLKSTIYSHSKQATGEIPNLGAIRGQGTQLYLEMMARNGLRHCYRSVNSQGVIIADYIHDIPETEIVGKFNCEGTDKHSYYGLRTNHLLVNPSGEYINGLYIRTDWRNPNHVYTSSKRAVTENKYYYPAESYYGKERFFSEFIIPYCIPVGDKVICDKIITTDMQDMTKTYESAIQIMHTIRSILNKNGLTVLDACFMLDKTGKTFWSEINQDCMRIVAIDNKDIRFDKDIWRAGGSSAKDAIMEKWIEFNKLVMVYFDKNRIISELDTYYKYNYEDSMGFTKHQNKQITVFATTDTIKTVNIFPDIMLYITPETEDKVYEHTMNNYCFVDGCNTKEMVVKLIQNSARRIVIDVTRVDLLELLPPNRVILRFNTNERYIINKYENYDAIMLSDIDPVKVCYYHKNIKRIYTYVSMTDKAIMPIIMKLTRVCPIITHLARHDIVKLMINPINNKVNCAIQDKTGHVIDFKQYTVDELLKLIDEPDIMKISPNDYNNSVVITYNKHMKDNYNTQSIIKANILTLDKDIAHIVNSNNPQQLLSNIMSGFYNISTLGHNDISNCSKFLLNFMAYMKSQNITIDDCLNKCNAEKWNIFKEIPNSPIINYYTIGITGNKYSNKTDNFILNKFGIKINRGIGRNLMINYDIVDEAKYETYFDKPVIFIPMRPKDMAYQCANGNLSGFVTYNSVFDNAPNIGKEICKEIDIDLRICLIKKKEHIVSKSIKVAAEHYRYVREYFNKENKYENIEISNVIGSSESYVVNGIMDYADAIVETGKSLTDNDLEIVVDIKNRGSLYIALIMVV